MKIKIYLKDINKPIKMEVGLIDINNVEKNGLIIFKSENMTIGLNMTNIYSIDLLPNQPLNYTDIESLSKIMTLDDVHIPVHIKGWSL